MIYAYPVPKEDKMEILPTVSASIAAGLFAVVTNFIAALEMPNAADGFAAGGAAVATLLAVCHARETNKTFWQIVFVVLASFFVGLSAPGAMVAYLTPESFPFITWHWWTIMGLAWGVAGASIVVGWQKLWDSLDLSRLFGYLIKKFFPFLFAKDKGDSDTKIIK